MPATVTDILPGLVRFTVPFPEDPRRKVNSYLFTAGREALLLDAAWDVPEAEEALRQAGVDELNRRLAALPGPVERAGVWLGPQARFR